MKGKIKEYGGKEVYASKAAKAKHEKKEGKKVEAKEKKTMTGGMRGFKLASKKK
jgi:hypothetical protein